jgi:hypothetical protein
MGSLIHIAFIYNCVYLLSVILYLVSMAYWNNLLMKDDQQNVRQLNACSLFLQQEPKNEMEESK